MHEAIYGVITLAIGYVLYLARSWVLAHTSPSQLNSVAALARTAVEAAEQFGFVDDSVTGADKYELASEALVAAAKRVGLKLKPEEVNAFIHAAVKNMNETDALLPFVQPAPEQVEAAAPVVNSPVTPVD